MKMKRKARINYLVKMFRQEVIDSYQMGGYTNQYIIDEFFNKYGINNDRLQKHIIDLASRNGKNTKSRNKRRMNKNGFVEDISNFIKT